MDSDLCPCGARDFIEHTFVECSLLVQLWREVEKVIQITTNKQLKLSTETKLFGLSKSDVKESQITLKEAEIINNILILAKFVINKTKVLEGKIF